MKRLIVKGILKGSGASIPLSGVAPSRYLHVVTIESSLNLVFLGCYGSFMM
jgi:hypothetical protein